MDTAQLLQSVQQAAQAAATAAQALKDANERRSTGFGEASKVVQCPKEFGTTSTTEDQSMWSDFAFSFKQWLFLADNGFEPDVKYVEENPNVAVAYQDNPVGQASKERSKKLYSILAGILKNRPLKLLRQIPDSNGLEAWRQLHNLYSPKTKGRAMALLTVLMGFPMFTKDKTCLEQLQSLERLAEEYRKASGQEVSDDILLSTLLRVLPRHLQQHIQLTMEETTNFQQVKQKILSYERVSHAWSKDRVLADIGAAPLGSVTSYANDSGGAAPMEVNAVQKGKGKWKGKSGDKGRGKGKPGSDKGKSKGKSNDKGKGKSYNGKGLSDANKGQSKGKQSSKVDANTCSYCGKTGHWQKDCYKRKADLQVRQVEEDPKDTSHTTGSSAASATAVRVVSVFEPTQQYPYMEDLTVFSQPSSSQSPFRLCAISETSEVCNACVKYDMTCTDHDACWTFSPDLNLCDCFGVETFSDALQHVRVVIDELSDDAVSCDVILDSGADISVLPLSYSSVGTSGPAPSSTYVDAQGCPLDVATTRIATLQFGDVAFKEKFIIADVTTPLVALGHIIRSGWSLVQSELGPCLVKGDHSIQVLYKNNSLCARGSISKVSQVDPGDALPAVRAVQLGIVLRNLTAGWNRISPHTYAIRTTTPKYVDTTLAPSEELLWLRTTLCFREGGGWEVLEFCEAVGELPGGIDEEIVFPSTVLEVVTIAHKYAVPAESLGFFMPDYGLSSERTHEGLRLADKAKPGDAMSEGYDPSIKSDAADEIPVDLKDGEPLQEDRIVPCDEEEAVVYIDGTALTVNSPLRALRAGCESFGLSKRGSKQMCLKRMLDHLQMQTLLAAHGAEVKLKAEGEREAKAQHVPKVPTPEEIQQHNLTHEPYKDWCEICVKHRARQDAHPKSSHENAGHSVISFDFCYCTRMPGEDDKQTVLVLHDRDTKLVHAIPTL